MDITDLVSHADVTPITCPSKFKMPRKTVAERVRDQRKRKAEEERRPERRIKIALNPAEKMKLYRQRKKEQRAQEEAQHTQPSASTATEPRLSTGGDNFQNGAENLMALHRLNFTDEVDKLFTKSEFKVEESNKPDTSEQTIECDDNLNVIETSATQILAHSSAQNLASIKFRQKDDPETTASQSCNSEIFVCGLCMKQFLFLTHIQRHVLEFHMAERHSYKCLCDYTASYYSIDELVLHKAQYARGEPLLKCDLCNLYFNFEEDLEQHRAMRSFSCNKCETVFEECSLLNKHWLHLNAIGPFKCEACRFETSSCVALKNHTCSTTTKVVRIQGPKRYRKKTKSIHNCIICEKVYRRPCELRDHQNIHHGLMYKCKYCGAMFDWKSVWRSHRCAGMAEGVQETEQIETETEQMEIGSRVKRMYQCNFCKVVVIGPWHLKNHMRRKHYITIEHKKDMMSCSKRINVRSVESNKPKMAKFNDETSTSAESENVDSAAGNEHNIAMNTELQMDEETRAATASLILLEGL